MVNSGKLSEARTVLRHAPDLAEEVVTGRRSLESAYNTACERKEEAEEAEYRMQELREKAPDLANLITEQQISLEEAWEKWQWHCHGDRDNDLQKIIELLCRNCGGSPKPAAERLMANFDPNELEMEEELSKLLIRSSEVLAFCAAMAKEVEERKPPRLGRRELGSTLDKVRAAAKREERWDE